MNTRPRDRYGRPLPWDASPDDIVPGVPERSTIEADQAWAEAMDYLELDLPFHAHEVFEQRWKCAPDDERACWQALAQWGAALAHSRRGNRIGARRVAARAQRGLRDATHVPHIVDVPMVLASCEDLQH